jgi:hypothetical protein
MGLDLLLLNPWADLGRVLKNLALKAGCANE